MLVLLRGLLALSHAESASLVQAASSIWASLGFSPGSRNSLYSPQSSALL